MDFFFEYLSKVDFTRGFQSFLFKWPCGKIENKESQVFETSILDGVRSKTIHWTLEIDGSPTERYKWFGLVINDQAVVPVVYNLQLLRAGCELKLQKSGFGVFESPDDYFGLNLDADTLAKLTENDYVIHCCLDIPIAIASMDVVKIDNEFKIPIPLTKFQRDMTKLHDVISIGDRTSDVKLIIWKKNEENVEEIIGSFNCHRNILISRSTYFDTMLNDEWKENGSGKVDIKEIDFKTMEIVLRYIYPSEMPQDFDWSDSANLIFAADMYRLNELKDHVACLMIKENGTENRLKHIRVADLHDLQQLKSVYIAQLSMDLEKISEVEYIESIGIGLFAKITKAACKRHRCMNSVTRNC